MEPVRTEIAETGVDRWFLFLQFSDQFFDDGEECVERHISFEVDGLVTFLKKLLDSNGVDELCL